MLLARLEILDQLVRLVLLVLTLQFLALQAQLALREQQVLKVILDLLVLLVLTLQFLALQVRQVLLALRAQPVQLDRKVIQV